MIFRHLTHLHFHGSPAEPVVVPNPVSTFMPGLNRRHYAIFWSYLIGGFGGLVGLTVATVDTHSVRLEDIFILLGSLFVPTLYVYYLDLRNMFIEPRWRTLVATFLLGAFLSTPIAFILEIFLPAGTGALGPAYITGAIEEAAKALAVLWLLRRKHRDLHFEMDGIVLGAAAGMGFAAIEDMLYGAAAFGHGVSEVLTTVWARQVLGPFGHGTWTAIVVGAIWRAKGDGAPRITPYVVGAYIIAVSLHAFWDWDPLSDLGGLAWLLGVGVVGILILRTMIHDALQQERDALGVAVAGQPAPEAPPTA